jgi:hypothetical protein
MVTANVAVRGNTVYKVLAILLGITSLKTRNPSEEWLFRRELPAQGLGSHWRNGFPPGITSSWMLIQIKMREKSSERVQF